MPLAVVSRWVAQIREDPASLLGGQRNRLMPHQLARVINWLDHQPAITILAAARALLFYTSRPGYGDEVASAMARLPTYLISGKATLAGMDVSVRFARFARSTFVVQGAGHAMVWSHPKSLALNCATSCRWSDQRPMDRRRLGLRHDDDGDTD